MNGTWWRISLLGLLLLLAGDAGASEFWSSLWRTPDQRGEQLLRQGDAAAAARTFTDPQRKAYAEFKAGDYPAAARDFAAFNSSDAHYNRGNALAHAGDLNAAIKAYDAALARDPNNRDARHNRELVAQALKHTPPPPPASEQEQSGKQQPDTGKDQSSNKDQNQKSAASNPQSGDKQNGQPGQDQHDGKPDTKPTEQAQNGEQAAPKNPASSGNSKPQPNPAAKNDAAQARRDAEAGIGQQSDKPATSDADQHAGKANPKSRLDAARINATQSNAPRNEQQLAQDQWLRQIPDDPGGLLQRKFMIEHLMRQQGNQP